jgi:hypothetical protein
VSNLKANTSMQVVDFSNRFSMTDMSTTLSFDPPISNNGLSPPAAREVECGSDICSSEVALAGLDLRTASAASISSLLTPYVGFDPSEGDNGELAFNIMTLTLGILGVVFTVYCIAAFLILRRKAKKRGETGGAWEKQPSLKWWIKSRRPIFEVLELSLDRGRTIPWSCLGKRKDLYSSCQLRAYPRVQKEVANGVEDQY